MRLVALPSAQPTSDFVAGAGLLQTQDVMTHLKRWIALGTPYIGAALSYLLAAQLGFRVPTVHPVVAAIWPAAGLALAVLLIGGARFWPALLLGAFMANALKGVPIPAALAVAGGNTLATV